MLRCVEAALGRVQLLYESKLSARTKSLQIPVPAELTILLPEISPKEKASNTARVRYLMAGLFVNRKDTKMR